MNIQFGSGVLFAVPAAGNQATNPTPYKFGVLQDASVDFKGDLKKLYGQKQFPVATARGKIDVMVKAKLAVVDVSMLNQLFFGQTQTTGISLIADDESINVAASVNVANAGTFITDFGVRWGSGALAGQQFTRVTGAPTTGQYKVNVAAGNYTFAAADAGNTALISYTYLSSARGATISLNNQLMGYAPEIRMFLYTLFRNKYLAIELLDVTLGSINIPSKNDDFWICDIEGSANADATDKLGSLFADLV